MNERIQDIIDADSLVTTAIEYISDKKYSEASEYISSAYKIFKANNYLEGLSISLSLSAFVDYSSNISTFDEIIGKIDEAKFLASRTDNNQAILIAELVLGNLNFAEDNKRVALMHYNNALKFTSENDKYQLASLINTRIRQLQNGLDYSLPTKSDPLVSLVKISRSITAITDIDELLQVMAEETKNAILADRCTVFLWDKESDELWSKVALGIDSSQEIRFPAEKGLAGYVVKTGETLNITDAYKDDRFNPEVDKKTGYKTKSILCMPIKNNNQEIIGAFQIINKIDGVFTKNDEDLLIAIGGSASIALENAQLFDKQLQMYHEQRLLFDSFIDTLATSIDARDKITAGHSSRVRYYSTIIAEAIGMPKKDISLLEKAAILHDIGKIGIRDSVLQKEGKLTDEEYKHIQEHVRITYNILNRIYMSHDFRIIIEMACSHHEKWDGTGYYRHLKGKEITLGGRILAVADVFDAITSKRHYRDKMPILNVIDIIEKGAGSHFDRSLVEIFLSIPLDKLAKVFISDFKGTVHREDLELLKNHTLFSLQKCCLKEDKDANDIALEKIFNKYYCGKENSEVKVEK